MRDDLVYIRYIVSMFLVDIVSLVLAILLAFLMKFGFNKHEFFYRMPEFALIMLTTIPMLVSRRLYTQRRFFYEESKEICISLIFAFILTFGIYAMLKNKEDYSRLLLGLSFLNAFFIMPALRYVAKRLLNGYIREDILIIEGPDSDKIYEFLKKEWYLAYNPVRRVKISDVHMYKDRFRSVVIPRFSFLGEFNQELLYISLHFRKIFFVPDISGLPFSNQIMHFSIKENLPLIETFSKLDSRLNQLLKRTFDIAFSSLVILSLLTVFSPVLILIVLLIKLTSKGPVFYKTKRIGKDGKVIEIWKFRTMYVDAEERLKQLLESDPKLREEWKKYFKLRNDPRITPIGRILRRFSLDELPQFINVLKGDLSVVGPRPIEANKEQIERYGEFLRLYTSVKPGITGLWQVSGRSELSYEERVKLDAIYIINWSFWLDLVIIFRTIFVVITGKGAY